MNWASPCFSLAVSKVRPAKERKMSEDNTHTEEFKASGDRLVGRDQELS